MKKSSLWYVALLLLGIFLLLVAFQPQLLPILAPKVWLALIFLVLAINQKSLTLLCLALIIGFEYVADLLFWDFNRLPFYIGLGLIFIALSSLRPKPKKTTFREPEQATTDHNNQVDINVIFGETTKYIAADQLESLKASASFGTIRLDLTQAQFLNNSIEIDVQGLFAEINIRIPNDVTISHNIRPIFAQVDLPKPKQDNQRQILLTGTAVLAQIDVRYAD